MQPDERLFRSEWGRLVPALARIFGLENLSVAEDVVQDVFCRAVEVWKLRGMPENPSAWLMKAAKNRAIDVLRRERTARTYLPELGRLFASEWTLVPAVNEYFSAETIQDDQLRMMFSCCDPALSEPTQVAMMLYLLCGFSVAEIAHAFLSKRATIEKRIERGKKALARSRTLFDMADSELPSRLSAVHAALYLLFNEGYHGSSQHAVRAELCREAIRLTALLTENPLVSRPETYALGALMCLHAARLPARIDGAGELVSLFEQDRSRWDATLVARGNALLNHSASGSQLSEYHIEAAIAAIHSNAARVEDTDWARLVWLYDQLVVARPSPVIALNRAIAIAQRSGAQAGIDAIRAIPHSEWLASYPFFPAALAELELRAGRADDARVHFHQAIELARNPAERRYWELRAASTAQP